MIFGLGGELFATPISAIQEILTLPAITRIPKSPDWLLGVINRRGDVTSVLDVRESLACARPAIGPQSRLLVVQTDSYTTALLVDMVQEIFALAPEDTVPAETLRDSERHVSRAFIRNGKLVSVIDLEPILTRDEFRLYQ